MERKKDRKREKRWKDRLIYRYKEREIEEGEREKERK